MLPIPVALFLAQHQYHCKATAPCSSKCCTMCKKLVQNPSKVLLRQHGRSRSCLLALAKPYNGTLTLLFLKHIVSLNAQNNMQEGQRTVLQMHFPQIELACFFLSLLRHILPYCHFLLRDQGCLEGQQGQMKMATQGIILGLVQRLQQQEQNCLPSSSKCSAGRTSTQTSTKYFKVYAIMLDIASKCSAGYKLECVRSEGNPCCYI